jgi:hypothetical protein
MVTIVKHAYSVLYKRLGNHKKKLEEEYYKKKTKKNSSYTNVINLKAY